MNYYFDQRLIKDGIEKMKITFSTGQTFDLVENSNLSDFQLIDASESDDQLWNFIQQWNSKADSFCFHTSGSTGQPKVIVLTRAQLLYSAEQTLKYLHLDKDDKQLRFLLCISPKFIGGIMLFVRAWLLNAELHILPPHTDFSKIKQTIDLCSLVPVQIQKLIHYPQKIKLLKNVLIGGAPLSPLLEQDVKKLLSKDQHWVATYGMTETASHIALRPVGTAYFKGIGDVFFDTDSRGCLTLKGSITNDQTLFTNDIISLIDSQTFEWSGRFDFIINSGGIKLSPEKIEKEIAQLIGSNDFMITWIPDVKLGQKAVILHEPTTPAPPWNLSGISKYEQPKIFLTIEKLPVKENNKLDRIKAHQLAIALYNIKKA